MKITEVKREFPFRWLRAIGWALIVIGFITFALACVDVAWTAVKYVGDDCEGYTSDPERWMPISPTIPCSHPMLLWTWISSGIWGSIFVIICGAVGASFSSKNMTSLKTHRDLFIGFCIMVALLFNPCMIILGALEIYNGMNLFYMDTGTEMLSPIDEVKLIVPLIVIIGAFFEWCLVLAGIFIGCCCAPIEEEQELVYVKRPPPPQQVVTRVVQRDPQPPPSIRVIEQPPPPQQQIQVIERPPPQQQIQVIEQPPQPQQKIRVIEEPEPVPEPPKTIVKYVKPPPQPQQIIKVVQQPAEPPPVKVITVPAPAPQPQPPKVIQIRAPAPPQPPPPQIIRVPAPPPPQPPQVIQVPVPVPVPQPVAIRPPPPPPPPPQPTMVGMVPIGPAPMGAAMDAGLNDPLMMGFPPGPIMDGPAMGGGPMMGGPVMGGGPMMGGPMMMGGGPMMDGPMMMGGGPMMMEGGPMMAPAMMGPVMMEEPYRPMSRYESRRAGFVNDAYEYDPMW